MRSLAQRKKDSEAGVAVSQEVDVEANTLNASRKPDAGGEGSDADQDKGNRHSPAPGWSSPPKGLVARAFEAPWRGMLRSTSTRELVGVVVTLLLTITLINTIEKANRLSTEVHMKELQLMVLSDELDELRQSSDHSKLDMAQVALTSEAREEQLAMLQDANEELESRLQDQVALVEKLTQEAELRKGATGGKKKGFIWRRALRWSPVLQQWRRREAITPPGAGS